MSKKPMEGKTSEEAAAGKPIALEAMELAGYDVKASAACGAVMAVVLVRTFVKAPEGLRMATTVLSPDDARAVGSFGIGGFLRPASGTIMVSREPLGDGIVSRKGYKDQLKFDAAQLANVECKPAVNEKHAAACVSMWDKAADEAEALQHELNMVAKARKLAEAAK